MSSGWRTFLIVWLGQMVSAIGSGLTSFGIGVWVFKTSGSAESFGMTMVCYALPNIVFSPLAGAFVDRWDRRIAMLVSDAGAGLTALALALLAAAPFAQEEVLLSRVREGGAPPDDPHQSLRPFAIDLAALQPGDFGQPTSGLLASPPEYSPSAGVLFRWTSGMGNVVANTVAALTGDPAHDDKAFVVVTNAKQVRLTGNKRGSVFLSCGHPELPKYGPQPVRACRGFTEKPRDQSGAQ